MLYYIEDIRIERPSGLTDALQKYKVGDTVKENQVIAVIEAMKMETSVVARMDGVIDAIFVTPGYSVAAGELLATIK